MKKLFILLFVLLPVVASAQQTPSIVNESLLGDIAVQALKNLYVFERESHYTPIYFLLEQVNAPSSDDYRHLEKNRNYMAFVCTDSIVHEFFFSILNLKPTGGYSVVDSTEASGRYPIGALIFNTGDNTEFLFHVESKQTYGHYSLLLFQID